MKTINFTAKEILPSLLDKSKTQTIRSAEKRVTQKYDRKIHGPCRYETVTVKNGKTTKKVEGPTTIYHKPPRFKVGEKVKLMWNQRSKHQWFCRVCGKPHKNDYKKFFKCAEHSKVVYNHFFNKTLGTATITEVFEIEMVQATKECWGVEGWILRIIIDGNIIERHIFGKDRVKLKVYEETLSEIAKRDGFDSANEMFKWFNRKYDLSTPKRFHVYRWEWY